MPKLLNRIVAALLVPCLISDPVTVMGCVGAAPRGRPQLESHFNQSIDISGRHRGLPLQLFTSQALAPASALPSEGAFSEAAPRVTAETSIAAGQRTLRVLLADSPDRRDSAWDFLRSLSKWYRIASMEIMIALKSTGPLVKFCLAHEAGVPFDFVWIGEDMPGAEGLPLPEAIRQEERRAAPQGPRAVILMRSRDAGPAHTVEDAGTGGIDLASSFSARPADRRALRKTIGNALGLQSAPPEHLVANWLQKLRPGVFDSPWKPYPDWLLQLTEHILSPEWAWSKDAGKSLLMSTILLLRAFGGLTLKETATVLGIGADRAGAFEKWMLLKIEDVARAFASGKAVVLPARAA